MLEYFWLIPFFPALSVILFLLFGRLMPKKYVSWQACFSVFLSFVLSLLAFIHLLQLPSSSFPL
ncbi:MAG: hypothetical protein J7L26_03460, partial [Candidatus Aminicenantes bacterium]|nr:hypothetical protein [Candidatus Aminicenantes bacterium]